MPPAATPDIDAVTALLHECASRLILPRFGRLRAEDVASKSDAEDLVTVVDHDVEARLTSALPDLAPAEVVAEEAVHRDPGRLRILASDGPVWLVDPLDGTRNFARGRDAFGIIVGWVVGGDVRAGWIVLPARGETFVAETGAGAFLNGAPLRVAPDTPARLRGSVYVRYMPAEIRERITRRAAGRYDDVAETGCGAVEYTDIIKGRKDFDIYYRLFPWDHAAPAAILVESGGAVDHLDGRPYGLRSANQPTVLASHAAVSRDVRAWFDEAAR